LDLLKVLGVPSFLLLPGCLFIFAMQLLMAFGLYGVKKDSRIPNLPITSPGFWIIAVSYSGVFAWFYSLATKNDYLARYGVTDLRNVWLSSIVIGGAVFCLIGWKTREQRNLRVPDPDDPPLNILQKMRRNGLKILAPKVQFTMNGIALDGFLIEKLDDDQTKVWVAPEIEAHWGDTPEAVAAHTRFSQLIQDRASLEEIVSALELGLASQQVSLAWRTQNSMPSPYHLKVENITRWLGPDSVVTAT
jgi:hypothetical protein